MKVMINKTKSYFIWEVSTILNQSIKGSLKIKEGEVTFDDGKIISGQVEFDMNSIELKDSDLVLESDLIKNIKNENFFNEKKYPTAKFIIKNITDEYLIGSLNVKDLTKSLQIPFVKHNNVYTGEFTFKRDAFELSYGENSFFGNIEDHFISEIVKIKFNIELIIPV